MKKNNLFVKAGRSNSIMKPLGVITSSAPSLTYLLTTSNLFNEVEIDGTEFVALSKELVKSLQGMLILIVLMISILYIYKPPKLVVWVLMLAGIMLFSSALLQTIGMTLLTYGLGLVFNSLTIDKLVARNNLLAKRKTDKDIMEIVEGKK